MRDDTGASVVCIVSFLYNHSYVRVVAALNTDSARNIFREIAISDSVQAFKDISFLSSLVESFNQRELNSADIVIFRHFV